MECDEGTQWSRRVKEKHASLGKPPPAPGTAYPCHGVPEEEETGKGGSGGNCAGGEFTQCKKVYHAYCMGFNIGNNELGSCPRHACLDCGEAAVYFCRYARYVTCMLCGVAGFRNRGLITWSSLLSQSALVFPLFFVQPEAAGGEASSRCDSLSLALFSAVLCFLLQFSSPASFISAYLFLSAPTIELLRETGEGKGEIHKNEDRERKTG